MARRLAAEGHGGQPRPVSKALPVKLARLRGKLRADVVWRMAKHLKLAYSTNGFTRYSLLTAIARIGGLGYDGVEILADKPHWYPQRPGAEVAPIVRALERAGLAAANINANCTFGFWSNPPPEPFFEPSLISPNRQLRRARIAMIIHTLEFARAVGGRNISITSGKALPEMPPHRARATLLESLKPVLEKAEKLGVNVGLECEPLLLIEWASELRQLIDEVGSARLGANLDLGHCIVIGERPQAAIKLLEGKIWNCHIEDLAGRKHYHLIPGEGTVNFSAIAEALRRVRYDRFATVELYTCTARPGDAARRSIDFLRPIFQPCG